MTWEHYNDYQDYSFRSLKLELHALLVLSTKLIFLIYSILNYVRLCSELGSIGKVNLVIATHYIMCPNIKRLVC